MQKYGIAMRGLGISLPEHIIKNDDLTALVDTSDEWITTRTGFKERRVVSGNEKMTSLAVEAAKQALAFADMSGEEIDLIILASSTPDYIYPAGAAVIQQGIGANRAFGFDIALGCSGLLYAMGIATQFIENGTIKNALIVASDTHSRYTDWYDRNTCVLFGDGAGAFVMGRQKEGLPSDLLSLEFLLDGAKGPEIRLPINRDNCPLVEPHVFEEKSSVYMNGREVFKFAVTEVPKHIERTLAKGDLSKHDIDHYILHQANTRIMSTLSERLGVPAEKIVVEVERYGNTSAATIPIALHEALDAGYIQPGKTLLFSGFGAGLAICTAVVKWNCIDHRKVSSLSAQAEQMIETV